MNDTEKQKIRVDFILFIDDMVAKETKLDINNICDYWLSIIDKTIKSKLEAVEGALDRHCNWTPTEGYGSEEEKGYQKGLIAEAKLLRSEILEIINKHK
jgi:hypothetical protein